MVGPTRRAARPYHRSVLHGRDAELAVVDALLDAARAGNGGALVVRGPYRYVRNPMISGVAFVLFGEAMMLRSVPHVGWALAFLVINLVFIPLFEEPGLEARFGEPYREYVRKVPRILPRLRTWKPDAPADADRSPG